VESDSNIFIYSNILIMQFFKTIFVEQADPNYQTPLSVHKEGKGLYMAKVTESRYQVVLTVEEVRILHQVITYRADNPFLANHLVKQMGEITEKHS